MAISENRRKKKLEAHRAKRKEQKRSVVRFESSGMFGRMTNPKNWPVISACVTSSLWNQGIGYAAIGRRGPQGQVVGVVFLLDTYCLGVKDVVLFADTEWHWHELLGRFEKREQSWEEASPECVRKLVDGVVAYAKSFGIEPHRDWTDAARIFGEIDASKCPTEFTYGKDGQPLFIPGPYDNAARVNQIMQALSRTAGRDRFDFITPIAAGDSPSDFIENGTAIEMEPTGHDHNMPCPD
ncbi:MAG: hypothetical protein NT013_03320 [Planctomycetia bacterium]|nr:hypothetical protein [Planctomycetia bacterium]